MTTSTSTVARGSVAVWMICAMSQPSGGVDGSMRRFPLGCTVGLAGQDEGRGVHLGDHRGPGHDVAGEQLVTLVETGVDRRPVDPDALGADLRTGGVGVAGGQGGGGDGGAGAADRRAHGDDLVLVAEQEREEPLVLGVERGSQQREAAATPVERGRVDRDRDLEALAVVAEVGRVGHRQVGLAQAVADQRGPGVVGEPTSWSRSASSSRLEKGRISVRTASSRMLVVASP